MKICKTCGKFILDDEEGELAFTVNPGIPDKEYVECESCHYHAIDRNKIIQCEACGERKEEDSYIPQYSIVVQFTNGGSRGFLISAQDKRQALEKLMDRLGDGNTACMDSIHIGFVYMDEDVIV